MKQKYYSMMGCFLFSFIGYLGFILVYHQLVDLNLLLGIGLGVVSLGIIGFLFYKKKVYAYLYPLVMSLLIGLISSFQSIYYGFFGIINYLIGWYNVKFDDAINLFYQKSIQSQDIQMTSLILISWVCLLIYHSIYQKKIIRYVIFTLAYISLSLYLDKVSYFGYSFLFIGLIGADMYYHNGIVNERIVHWTTIFIICFGIISFPMYQENLSLQAMKQSVVNEVEDLRYGEDSLPEGNLNKASDIHKDETERLKVTVTKKKNLYLKGFVGSRLSKNQWGDLKKASYNGDHAGMLEWLGKQHFSPSYQYDLYQQLSSLEDTSQTVEVENIEANKKYIYTPYGTTRKTVQKNTITKDTNLQSSGLFGSSSYTYKETGSFSPSELTLGQDWLNNPNKKQQKYLNSEAVYRQFVYEQYTKVAKRYQKSLKQLLEQEDFDNTGLYSICQHIRDMMSKNLTYSDEIESTSSDVLNDFIHQKQAGNDVLYASLATQAFRYYQIPARYVEGYYLKSSQINSHGTAILTSKSAHAWVEVYFDGMGWLPIDMTPGYYYDVYTLMNMVSSPQGNQSDVEIKKNKKESSQVDEGQSGGIFRRIFDNMKDVGVFSLGVATFIILIIFILWVFLEIRRVLNVHGIRHAYKHAILKDQTKYLYHLVIFYLQPHGIDYHIGLNNNEIDKMLTEMNVCYRGDFIRISELFEKSFYGDISLKEYEMNIIIHFIRVLYQSQTGLKWYERIQKRYKVVPWRRIYRELIRGRFKNG